MHFAHYSSDSKVHRLRGSVRGLGEAELRGRKWNSEISSLTSTADIMRVQQRHGIQFNIVNAVTALNRIAKAPSSGNSIEDPHLHAFALETLRVSAQNEINTRQLCNTVWALSKLLCAFDETLANSIASASIRSMTAFDAQNLSNMAWSLAALRVVNTTLR